MSCFDTKMIITTVTQKIKEQLAEEGLSADDIQLLEQEVNLAREKAKGESYKRGDTLREQKQKIEEAVKQAVKDWDQKIHARLEDDMELIRTMGAAKKLPVGHD